MIQENNYFYLYYTQPKLRYKKMINPLTTYFEAMQQFAKAIESLKQTREQIAVAKAEMDLLKTQDWELPEKPWKTQQSKKSPNL